MVAETTRTGVGHVTGLDQMVDDDCCLSVRSTFLSFFRDAIESFTPSHVALVLQLGIHNICCHDAVHNQLFEEEKGEKSELWSEELCSYLPGGIESGSLRRCHRWFCGDRQTILT